MRQMEEIPMHLRRKFFDHQIHELLGEQQVQHVDFLLQKKLDMMATVEILAKKEDLKIYYLVCYLDLIFQDKYLESSEVMELDYGYISGKVFEVAMTSPEVDLAEDSRCLLEFVRSKLLDMQDCMDEISRQIAEARETVRYARGVNYPPLKRVGL